MESLVFKTTKAPDGCQGFAFSLVAPSLPFLIKQEVWTTDYRNW
jgi:hypothetical protein